MKQRHFKALTSLLLVVVMLASMLPAIPVVVTAADTNTYEKVDLADIQATDKVIIVSSKGSSHFALYSGNGTSKAPTAKSVTISGDEIEAADDEAIFWNISNDNGTLTIYVDGTTSTWLYCTSSNNGVRVGTNEAKTFTMDTSGYLKHTGTSRYLGVYNSQDWRCYTNTTGNTAGQTFSFYRLKAASSCPHANTTAVGEAKEATCTETGITAGVKCLDCQEIVEKQKEIPMIAHDYVNGFCSVCNAELPKTLTITKASFPAVSNSYAWYDWSENTASGDTITGKGFLYQNTAIQMNGSKAGNFIYNDVALPGAIVSVTLTTASGTNRNYDVLTSDTPFNSSTGKLTGTSAKKIVTTTGTTWEFDTTHRYFAIVLTDSSAGYLASIEITYAAPCTNHTGGTPTCTEPAKCENCGAEYGEPAGHIEEEIPAQAPSCTEDGLTAGVKCSVCQEVLTQPQVDPATGHTDVNPADSKCDTCGTNLCTNHVWVDGEVEVEGNCTTDRVVSQICENCGEPGEDKVITAPGHTPVTDNAVAPDCTTAGKTEGSHCDVCGETIVAQQDVPATGHTMVDGVCSECGYEAPISVGDKIYFTAEGQYMTGISTASKPYGLISDNVADALVLTVEAGVSEGTYAFKCDAGYLYWTGGTNNTLGAKPEKDASASWIVTVDDEGAFTISVSVENSNGYGIITYNTSATRFATYKITTANGSGYHKVQIQKAPEAPEWTGYSATLNGGVTINVEYDISAEWIEAHPEAKVAFVFADGVELAGSTPVAPTAGKTTYSFTLTPQAIDKQLYFVITEGETEIARSEVSYSIYKAELDEVADQYAGLSDLLSSIDTFTATANDKTNTVEADESIKDVAAWAPTTTGTILNSFKLDLGQQIAVKIGVNTSIDYTGYKVTVTLGDNSLLTEADFTKYITSEGKLVVKGLAPTHLNDTLTVTVYDTEGNEVASTSFVINSYLKKLYDEDEEFKNLAAATYNYGIAAEAYAGN